VALLTDDDFLRAQLAAPEALVDEARRALATLEAEARDAWRRYPAVAGSGFHSGPPDVRPLLLAWTVRHVREAGFYTPDELERLAEDGEGSRAWLGVEAFRLCAYLAALRAVLDRLLARALPATDYRTTVEPLTWQFSRLRVRPVGQHVRADAGDMRAQLNN
jgi:hypothetical protein